MLAVLRAVGLWTQKMASQRQIIALSPIFGAPAIWGGGKGRESLGIFFEVSRILRKSCLLRGPFDQNLVGKLTPPNFSDPLHQF